MTQPMKKKKLRIKVTGKDSITGRTDIAKVVGTNGPNSPLWKADPHIESTGTAVSNRGNDLANADAAVKALENKLIVARGVRDTAVVAFDAAFDVYAASVSSAATSPEDIADLGLTVLDTHTYPLVPPIGVDVSFDVVESLILIHVDRAPGLENCIVEISASPIGPDTWKRLSGYGATREVSGYAPGTYWVHAASARASKESDFTGPVAVIVK